MPEYLLGKAVVEINATDIGFFGQTKKAKNIVFSSDPENKTIHLSLKGSGLSGFLKSIYNPEVVMGIDKYGYPVLSVVDSRGQFEVPVQLNGIDEDSVSAASESRVINFRLKGFKVGG